MNKDNAHHLPEKISTSQLDKARKVFLKEESLVTKIKKIIKKPLEDSVALHLGKSIREQTINELTEGLNKKPSKVLQVFTSNKVGYRKKDAIELFKKQIIQIKENKAKGIEHEPNLLTVLSNLDFYGKLTKNYFTDKELLDMEYFIDDSKITNIPGKTLFTSRVDLYDRNPNPFLMKSGSLIIKSGRPIVKENEINPMDMNIQTISELIKVSLEEDKQLAASNILPQTTEDINTTLSMLDDNKNQCENIIEIWKEQLEKYKKKYKDLSSIGGKIHLEKSIPEDELKAFTEKFQFKQTPFKLIHANTSILLNPSYLPEELMMMIFMLEKFGILNGYPELQLSIPGRLPNWMAGILGSSMLFSTKIHREYNINSFSTDQNEATGARIMAYDAGVLNKNFKNIPKKTKGRTDMLGLRDISLIPKYQLVGTLLSHAFYKGKHRKIGIQFIKEYIQLLEQHDMKNILEQERVYDKNSDNAKEAEVHYKLVKSCTDKHKTEWTSYNISNNKTGLLIFSVEELLQKYKKIVYYT